MQTHYETNRLILEVCTPDRCHEVLRFYEDNRKIFEPFDPLYPAQYFTPEYQYSTLAYEYKIFLEQKHIRFYLFEKRNPHKIIGTISFGNIIKGFVNSTVIGYKLDRHYHHRGYAFEALQKGIEIMFFEENIHRINAYIMPNNIPSIKLIQRLYFSYEGIAREYALIQGRWTDHYQYSLINHP